MPDMPAGAQRFEVGMRVRVTVGFTKSGAQFGGALGTVTEFVDPLIPARDGHPAAGPTIKVTLDSGRKNLYWPDELEPAPAAQGEGGDG